MQLQTRFGMLPYFHHFFFKIIICKKYGYFHSRFYKDDNLVHHIDTRLTIQLDNTFYKIKIYEN